MTRRRDHPWLLARFIQLRDDKQFDAWSELFTDDAVFTYGIVRLEGRPAIREHVALLRRDKGKHLCFNSVIDVDGDRAFVTSDFAKLDPAEAERALSLAPPVVMSTRWCGSTGPGTSAAGM